MINLKSGFYQAMTDEEESSNITASWTNFLTNLNSSYDTAQTALTTSYENQQTQLEDAYAESVQNVRSSTQYDISSAYVNYKKSQLALMQNRYLGEGYKDYAGQELSETYQSAYKSYKSEEASSLKSLASSYESKLQDLSESYLSNTVELSEQKQAALEEAQGSYSDLAGKYASIVEQALAYGAEYGDISSGDLDQLEASELYKLNTETGEYEITAKGINFFDKIFNARTSLIENGEYSQYSFVDWLKHSEDEDVASLAEVLEDDDQRALLYEMLGGEALTDAAYTEEEATSRVYNEEENALKITNDQLTNDLSEYEDQYIISGNFVDEHARQKYLNAISESKQSYEKVGSDLAEASAKHWRDYDTVNTALVSASNQFVPGVGPNITYSDKNDIKNSTITMSYNVKYLTDAQQEYIKKLGGKLENNTYSITMTHDDIDKIALSLGSYGDANNDVQTYYDKYTKKHHTEATYHSML